jgi:hypothetical protein
MAKKQAKKETLPAPRARSGAAPTKLFKELRDLIQSTRAGVAQAVNSALVLLYWQVGHRIRSEILESRRAEYGEQVVPTLATQLALEFGQGFAEKNLRRMIQLAEVFPDREIVVTLSRQLGWSHFLAILPLKDPLQRDFYAEMCRIERWSVRTLRAKIGGEESEEAFRACERRLAGFLRQLRTKLKAADKTETAVWALVRDILTFIDEAAYIAQYPQYRQGNFYKEVLKSFVKYFAVSRAGCEWPEAIEDFEGADSVPIMTMHKSKGLEYHTIVFVGLEDSALFGFKDDPHEEGCGFFVAFSRAKKRVVFTFSKQRPRRVGGAPEVQDRSKIKVLYDILLKAGVRPETID